MLCHAIYWQKARIKRKDIDGSECLTGVCVCQWVNGPLVNTHQLHSWIAALWPGCGFLPRHCSTSPLPHPAPSANPQSLQTLSRKTWMTPTKDERAYNERRTTITTVSRHVTRMHIKTRWTENTGGTAPPPMAIHVELLHKNISNPNSTHYNGAWWTWEP